MAILGYVPDLMDRSRVSASKPEIRFISSIENLVEESTADDIVVLDLGRPGVIDAIPEISARRTVGFISHVDGEGIDKARAAGISEVTSRSRFFNQVEKILSV